MEIDKGIIIEKLKVKDGDTLIVTVDPDIWDISEAHKIYKMVVKIFPNNNVVVTTLKGIEIINRRINQEVAVNETKIYQKRYHPLPPSDVNYNYSCEFCNKNPKNGGDGICFCIIGTPDIKM